MLSNKLPLEMRKCDDVGVNVCFYTPLSFSCEAETNTIITHHVFFILFSNGNNNSFITEIHDTDIIHNDHNNHDILKLINTFGILVNWPKSRDVRYSSVLCNMFIYSLRINGVEYNS